MLESRMLGLMPFLENRVSMCLEAQVLFYASLLVRFFLRWSLFFFSLKYPLLQRDCSYLKTIWIINNSLDKRAFISKTAAIYHRDERK